MSVNRTYDDMVSAVSARLSAASAEHSLRVAEMSAHLAHVYGLDEDAARVAGLLHDWCRDIPGPELMDRANELGVTVSAVDRVAPYLLHGPVGAREVSEVFAGLSADVIGAVAAHTYGSPDMTPLAMTVYVADTIEPGRTHEGVAELRSAVGEVSLGELFARTYAASLRHLVDKRRPLHEASIVTWNALVTGLRP